MNSPRIHWIRWKKYFLYVYNYSARVPSWISLCNCTLWKLWLFNKIFSIDTILKTGFPLFLSRQIPWFPKSFPWFFLGFHQDILFKKTYLFFLNVALVTLVYANIAISWQILRFNSLKKHFPQIYRFNRFENGLEKSSLIWNFFPWFWLKNWFFPDFPDWKKSSKFSLNSLICGNPVKNTINFNTVNPKKGIIQSIWENLGDLNWSFSKLQV